MTVAHFLELFGRYGLAFVAVVTYCEYLNLPGFPAGVIMPALGVLAQQSSLNIFVALLISVCSGTLASMTLYGLFRLGGVPLVRFFSGKSEKFHKLVEEIQEKVEWGSGRALFICRLVPVLRTIISIPAGILAVPPRRFLISTVLGVICWNTVFILAGYFGSAYFLGI